MLCGVKHDCEMQSEDDFFVRRWIVSIDTGLDEKRRKSEDYCGPIECISIKEVPEEHTPGVFVCVPCSLSPQLGVVDGAGEAEGAECTARKEKSLGKQEHTCCLRGE